MFSIVGAVLPISTFSSIRRQIDLSCCIYAYCCRRRIRIRIDLIVAISRKIIGRYAPPPLRQDVSVLLVLTVINIDGKVSPHHRYSFSSFAKHFSMILMMMANSSWWKPLRKNVFYPILKKLLLRFATEPERWRAGIIKGAIDEGSENTSKAPKWLIQRLAVFVISAGC